MTAACLLLLLVSTRALVPSLALTVSPLVSDGAVLVAAPAAAHIFGEGAARKQEVRVAIDGQTLATTTANEDGTFGASLPPRKASTTPVTVTVSTDTQQVVVNNILFGEVWACSGQSNMQMTVSSAANATAEILRAKQYKHIRVATVAQISLPNTTVPAYEAQMQQAWTDAATGLDGAPWTTFSATCWFFGRNLYDRLGGDVPVGLVAVSVGGTAIELWTPVSDQSKCQDAPCFDTNRNCALWAERGECKRNPGYMLVRCRNSCKQCAGPPWRPGGGGGDGHATLPYLQAKTVLPSYSERTPVTPEQYVNDDRRGHSTIFDAPEMRAALAGQFVNDMSYARHSPNAVDDIIDAQGGLNDDRASLWNGMLAPVLRMSLSGLVWYQAEANYYNPTGRTPNVGYRCLFPAFVNAVRNFYRASKPARGDGMSELPFGFVQLAGYCDTLWKAADCSYSSLNLVAELRWAQVSGLAKAPNRVLGSSSFFATAIDLEASNGTVAGNATWGDIHPPDKQHVGDRLARAAMAVVYGDTTVHYAGPVLSACEVRTSMHAKRGGDNSAYLDLAFDATLLRGDAISLHAAHGLEILLASSNGTWLAAPLVRANGYTARAQLPTANSDVIAVRYAWRDNPCCPQSYGPTEPPSNYTCKELACAIYASSSELPAPPFYASVDRSGRCQLPWNPAKNAKLKSKKVSTSHALVAGGGVFVSTAVVAGCRSSMAKSRSTAVDANGELSVKSDPRCTREGMAPLRLRGTTSANIV
ncbi:sialate O-acetylesterase [Pycnococcus provasolii]